MRSELLSYYWRNQQPANSHGLVRDGTHGCTHRTTRQDLEAKEGAEEKETPRDQLRHAILLDQFRTWAGVSVRGDKTPGLCVCVWFYVPHVARGAWQEPEAAESDGGEREKAGRRRSDTVWPWFQVLIHLNTRISAGSTPNMSTCKKKH